MQTQSVRAACALVMDSWPLKNEWINWLDHQGIKLPKAPRGEV
jgi:hypothetical protein